MKKAILALAIVLIGAAVAGAIYLRKNRPVEPKYRTAKVERGAISTTVTATGTVNAVNTVTVGSQVSGTISKIYVDFNSEVTAGQVLAQIDPTFLEAQVAEAEANLERAAATVKEAKRAYDRARQMLEQRLVSQAEVDQAQTGYETALAQEKQATAALSRARINLRYATIRSPIDGVVVSRSVDVGQTVAASFQAPTLFTLAEDLTRMKLQLNVDEADVGKIEERQTVTFTVDAYPEEQFTGQVTQIRLAPNIVQNVVTYDVIAQVPNPDLKLRPGMTANASVLIARKDDVLKVPNLALRFHPEAEGGGGDAKAGIGNGGGKGSSAEWKARGDASAPMGRGTWKTGMVWVQEGSGPLKPIPVGLGIGDREFTELVGGDLQEGQQIIVGAVVAPAPTQAGFPGMGGFGGPRRR